MKLLSRFQPDIIQVWFIRNQGFAREPFNQCSNQTCHYFTNLAVVTIFCLDNP